MTEHDLTLFRQEKDTFFKSHPQSPLLIEQQSAFTGLTYYPYNPALDLTVQVEPLPDGDFVTFDTTTGDLRRYRRYGRFSFVVDGETAQLTIYEAPHGYFLPFVDVNAGTETYPAGRYLEPDKLNGGTFHVDLNLAYNPYCAYNDEFSCPITPTENRVKVAVQAGEKIPVGVWIDG